MNNQDDVDQMMRRLHEEWRAWKASQPVDETPEMLARVQAYKASRDKLSEDIRAWLEGTESDTKRPKPEEIKKVLEPLTEFVASLPRAQFAHIKLTPRFAAETVSSFKAEPARKIRNSIVQEDARLQHALREAIAAIESACATVPGASEKSGRRELQKIASHLTNALSAEKKAGAPKQPWRHAELWSPIPDSESAYYEESLAGGQKEATGPVAWESTPTIREWGLRVQKIFEESLGKRVGLMEDGPVCAFIACLIKREFHLDVAPTRQTVAECLSHQKAKPRK